MCTHPALQENAASVSHEPLGAVRRSVIATVAEMIRAKIDAGVLPGHAPHEVIPAHGHGAMCAACEHPIVKPQILWSLYVNNVRYSFHVGCHMLWEAECRRRPSRQT